MFALGQKNQAVTSRFCIEAALRVQGRRTCTILNGEEPAMRMEVTVLPKENGLFLQVRSVPSS